MNKSAFKFVLLFLGAVFLSEICLGQSTQALFGDDELMPEFPVAIKGVASFDLNPRTGNTDIDFSDTELMLGLRQKLYNNWRGQFVFAMQFPDSDTGLGKLFYTQSFLQIDNYRNSFRLGRSNSPSMLLGFPTLRDDDGLNFNYSLNPFSNGNDVEYNQYANTASYSHIFKKRYTLMVHADNFLGQSEDASLQVNAFGLSFAYRLPDSENWNRKFIRQIGVAAVNYLTDRTGYSGWYDQSIRNYMASVALNLRPDPVYFWDFMAQGIYNEGFSEVKDIKDYFDYTRSESFAFFTSLRFIYRKLERPTLMSSGGFGYKSFTERSENEQFMAYYNVFYRLGNNFDLGLQYKYYQNSGQTSISADDSKHLIQFALVFTFDRVFNSQFDDRFSLLSLEHRYIP
ncbi:hypothetical protein FUAX_35640 [Fulvitalea axinellae]|uniref:Porin n=1 Tax=Fulvitalea axinellae TaxID=1182444 RepID=A0AAU9CVT4_9BACT|nr:hypothetical protein FUAX_35640 [Fulvitalea axinellae]